MYWERKKKRKYKNTGEATVLGAFPFPFPHNCIIRNIGMLSYDPAKTQP